ncbi:MAG: C25 family peptidase propeptide domain-containing protein [Ignavibacteriaceae bacterium]|nr:C25 family peptidase propeptide domain-containing protein [Ignavibacteriaceae bacterium]
MRFLLPTLIIIYITQLSSGAQTIKLIESSPEYIKVELSYAGYYKIKEKVYQGKKFVYIERDGVSFRKPGEPWLPTQIYNFGVPYNKKANYKILSLIQEKMQNILVLPYPDSLNQPFNKLTFDASIYTNNKFFPPLPVNVTGHFIMRYVNGTSLEAAPYQYNPISRELLFNNKIVVQISFDTDPLSHISTTKIKDKFTEDFIATGFINPKEAIEFIGKPVIPNRVVQDTIMSKSAHTPKQISK